MSARTYSTPQPSGTHGVPARRLSFIGLLTFLAACGDSSTGNPSGPERIPVASVRIAAVTEVLLVGATRALQAVPLSATGAVLDDRPITWSSDDQQIATISATGLLTAHAAGTVEISATSEGKTSHLEVQIMSPNPLPILTALSPANAPAGTPTAIDVDVSGTGFNTNTRLQLDGVEQPTEYLTTTRLRLRLQPEALKSVAQLVVTAVAPAPGGGTSNALTFEVEPSATPTIAALEPRQITAGWTGSFTLAITGSGFTPRTTVRWDGAPRPARFIDAGTLHITIDPPDVRVARQVPLIVEAPAPGGGRATATFAVNAIPVARVAVLSPAGFAWTWRNHGLPLSAVAEDQLGRELLDRTAHWTLANPRIGTVAPVSDREATFYGTMVGETEVEATMDGVKGQRTVRVHDTPAYDLVYETGTGDDRTLMLWDLAVGNGPRRLRTNVVAFNPSPSPDGREIAFAGVEPGAGPTGNVDLFITTRDGTIRRIASNPAFDSDPAWSPDGTKIAFTSARAAGWLDIWVLDLAGGGLRQLTSASAAGNVPGSGHASRAPTWSPDGTELAYSVQTGGSSVLWAMAADGSNKRQLTTGDVANDYEPAWSPDGSVIAFAREFRQPQQAMVMTVRPDGTGETSMGGRIVNMAATPAYSPDGHWVTTSQTRGNTVGTLHAFSLTFNAGPRIVMPLALGGGRHARWMRRP